MEYDAPSKNADNKMPILDMKVWMEESSGNILFQHYEKPTASGNISHANPAQAVVDFTPITFSKPLILQDFYKSLISYACRQKVNVIHFTN